MQSKTLSEVLNGKRRDQEKVQPTCSQVEKTGLSEIAESPVFIGRDGEI